MAYWWCRRPHPGTPIAGSTDPAPEHQPDAWSLPGQSLRWWWGTCWWCWRRDPPGAPDGHQSELWGGMRGLSRNTPLSEWALCHYAKYRIIVMGYWVDGQYWTLCWHAPTTRSLLTWTCTAFQCSLSRSRKYTSFRALVPSFPPKRYSRRPSSVALIAAPDEIKLRCNSQLYSGQVML